MDSLRRRREAEVSSTGQATASMGSFANSGYIRGDVTLVSAEAARSAYREQVRRIAPSTLIGRERELAELAQFCTTATPGSYAWWKAPAWAGKSALLSWFVLHPPPGVQVVSFFVTSRLAAQNDRSAFVDVMLEQLADLLGRPLPGYLTNATRDGHLLAMLALSAEACQQRGERLVLVVDGLDEDCGITAEGGHSIAALLPAQPPSGLRIVVSGRPNPPLPSDVPNDHPLRSAAIVRTLSRSPHAELVKADAERDLKRLVKGTPAEQDLLGLVTASGGGLSGPDLADLTGLREWEIEEHLHTVAGRAFSRRLSRWQPEERPTVYILRMRSS